MLEIAMVEVAMEMEKAMKKPPLSNHSTALSRSWLQNLTNLTCQMMMMMMMMNPQGKRKVPLTVPTPGFDPSKQEEEAWKQVKGQTFSFYNAPDLDSHADCCVCGKEVFVFKDFYWEVTVTGWDPEGETNSLRIVSEALGYTIP
jgi:hypothetical protein